MWIVVQKRRNADSTGWLRQNSAPMPKAEAQALAESARKGGWNARLIRA